MLFAFIFLGAQHKAHLQYVLVVSDTWSPKACAVTDADNARIPPAAGDVGHCCSHPSVPNTYKAKDVTGDMESILRGVGQASLLLEHLCLLSSPKHLFLWFKLNYPILT